LQLELENCGHICSCSSLIYEKSPLETVPFLLESPVFLVCFLVVAIKISSLPDIFMHSALWSSSSKNHSLIAVFH
jgi:hypothetical protein